MQDEIKGLKCVQSSIAVVPMEETVIEWVIFKGNIIFCECVFAFKYKLRRMTPSFFCSFCLFYFFVVVMIEIEDEENLFVYWQCKC